MNRLARTAHAVALLALLVAALGLAVGGAWYYPALALAAALAFEATAHRIRRTTNPNTDDKDPQ